MCAFRLRTKTPTTSTIRARRRIRRLSLFNLHHHHYHHLMPVLFIRPNELDIETLLKLRHFVNDQLFDTDSVSADCDCKDNEMSSIHQTLGSLSNSKRIDIDRVTNEFIFYYRSKTDGYSVGYRFYYGPFYKGNNSKYVFVRHDRMMNDE